MKNISVKKFSQEGWRILKGIPFLYFLKQKRQTLNFNGKKKNLADVMEVFFSQPLTEI